MRQRFTVLPPPLQLECHARTRSGSRMGDSGPCLCRRRGRHHTAVQRRRGHPTAVVLGAAVHIFSMASPSTTNSLYQAKAEAQSSSTVVCLGFLAKADSARCSRRTALGLLRA